jgi:hypothetical protein
VQLSSLSEAFAVIEMFAPELKVLPEAGEVIKTVGLTFAAYPSLFKNKERKEKPTNWMVRMIVVEVFICVFGKCYLNNRLKWFLNSRGCAKPYSLPF